MRGYNHIAGGLAFTGIFASFADVNIFSKPAYLGACVFFSLLPDIDHTRSTLGKAFWPVAKLLDKRYGHRTVTHCALFLLAVVAVVGLCEAFITGHKTLTGISALALASHLLFDMCTRQGIPFFLPFTRARCVLPGNPNMRLSSKSPLAEIAVFFGFCLLILSTLPLMAAGFWATVNNEFATFGHVLREFERKSDILYLETKEGHTGQVVAATATGAVLWNGRRFSQLVENSHHPDIFRHTGKLRQTERLEFVSINSDSLRHILRRPVMNLEASSSAAIRYRLAGQQYEQPSLKLEYPEAFDFTEVKADSAAALGQITRLRATIAANSRTLWLYSQEQQQKATRVRALHSTYYSLSAYEQGKASEEITKLGAELKAARPPDSSVETASSTAEIIRLKSTLKGQKHTFTGVATIWKP